MNQNEQMLTEKEKLRLRSIKERESKWYFKTMIEPSLGHLITVGFMEGLKFRDEQAQAAAINEQLLDTLKRVSQSTGFWYLYFDDRQDVSNAIAAAEAEKAKGGV